MTPHKQLNLHKPDEGIIGDCYRTCIACLLDLHPSEVPHFYKSIDEDLCEGNKRARLFLQQRKLELFDMAVAGSLEDVLASAGSMNPDCYWMLTGESRTGCNHIVICKGGEIVHDPSLTDSGIIGPTKNGCFYVSLLVPAPMVEGAG